MWTLDPRSRQIINDACALFGFNPLPVLHDFRARVLFSVFNCVCVSEDVAQRMFRQLMSKIDKVVDKDVSFDKDFHNENDLSTVSEWALISLLALIAG